jgi:hypothetical protein
MVINPKFKEEDEFERWPRRTVSLQADPPQTGLELA